MRKTWRREPWEVVDNYTTGVIRQAVQHRRACFNGSTSSYATRTVSADRRPLWMPREPTGLRAELASEPTAERPRVVVCLAGLVRTLVHPQMWRSIARFVTLSGSAFALPTVAVLEHGGSSIQGWADQLPDACALQTALRGLGVRRVKWVNSTLTPAPCGHGGAPGPSNLNQFTKWAQCVPLARSIEEEHGRKQKHAGEMHRSLIDAIFITRPDMYFDAPVDLWHATRHIAPTAVLSCLDFRSLWPRRTWTALETFPQARCLPNCVIHKPVYTPGRSRKGHREYDDDGNEAYPPPPSMALADGAGGIGADGDGETTLHRGVGTVNELCFRANHLVTHNVYTLETSAPDGKVGHASPVGCRRSYIFAHSPGAAAVRFATSPWTGAWCLGGRISRWNKKLPGTRLKPRDRSLGLAHGCSPYCAGVPPLKAHETCTTSTNAPTPGAPSAGVTRAPEKGPAPDIRWPRAPGKDSGR